MQEKYHLKKNREHLHNQNEHVHLDNIVLYVNQRDVVNILIDYSSIGYIERLRHVNDELN